MAFVEDVRGRTTIAELTEKANEQHYEVSTEFVLSCLGPYAKYSSCLYPTGKETLEEAEILMLESYCDKARLTDGLGLDILDLGCGWGSLSLYLAQKYPKSRITGLSNSSTQKAHIDTIAHKQGLRNLEIVTADVNTWEFNGSKHFDRILCIGMLEHMKNYEVLLRKIFTWLRLPTEEDPNESLLFVDIFCHRTQPYHFEHHDGWMAQMFFSGTWPLLEYFSRNPLTDGRLSMLQVERCLLMTYSYAPRLHVLQFTHSPRTPQLYFQSDLTILRSWYIDGCHYSRTCEDWLKVQDQNARHGLTILHREAEARGVGKDEGTKVFNRFRVYYMACSELFKMDKGQQWGVGHYLFKPKRESL